jgi:membrane-associated phospholipid phosphatase
LRRRYDAQLRWMLRRLTPGQYLGLHLTVGLLAAGGSLWLFGGVVEDLITGDPLVRFDRVVDDYLHSHATPHLTTFFLVVTALGSTVAIVLLGVVVAALLAWRRLWTLLWTWIAAVAGSALIDWLLKGIFQRPRPHFAHPLVVETGYSFPSGHAMESFVVYGMLAYLAVLWLRNWEACVAAVCGAALVVVLIGFSRMYLGVHYFSDVVAGYAAGGVWLSALITGAETIRRGGKHGNESKSPTS